MVLCLCARKRAWAVNPVCASVRCPSSRSIRAGLQEDTVHRWMGKGGIGSGFELAEALARGLLLSQLLPFQG